MILGACISVGSIVLSLIVLIFANQHGDYIRFLQICFVLGMILFLFGFLESLSARKHLDHPNIEETSPPTEKAPKAIPITMNFKLRSLNLLVHLLQGHYDLDIPS